MPRDSNGTYTLPGGNPVVSGTIIESNWANTTMPDLGNEITDSLSRSGEGGMLAPFKKVDGSGVSPSDTWLNDLTSGWYRAGSLDFRFAVATADILRVNPSGLSIWNGSSWELVYAGDFLPRDGSEPMTGDLDLDGNRLVNYKQTLGPGAPSDLGISSEGDGDTGIYSPADDSLLLTAGADNFSDAPFVSLSGTAADEYIRLFTGNTLLYINGPNHATTPSEIRFASGGQDQLTIDGVNNTIDIHSDRILNLPVGTYSTLALSMFGETTTGIVSTHANELEMVTYATTAADRTVVRAGDLQAFMSSGNLDFQINSDTSFVDPATFKFSSSAGDLVTFNANGVTPGTDLYIDLHNNMSVKNAVDPVDAQDLVTKAYGDANYGGGGSLPYIAYSDDPIFGPNTIAGTFNMIFGAANNSGTGIANILFTHNVDLSGGNYSNVTCLGGSASNSQATALGSTAVADAQYATAVGYDSQANGNGSLAVGYQSRAEELNDIAIGFSATCDTGSVALGGQAEALGSASIAIGQAASATQSRAICIGYLNTSSAVSSISIGVNSAASGDNSIAIGLDTSADTTGGVAIGYQSETINQAACAVGYQASADSLNATTFGNQVTATAQNSVSVGYLVNATSANAVALGSACDASGDNAVAVGTTSDATGANSIAIGFSANANALFSTRIGSLASIDAAAEYAISIGYSTAIPAAGVRAIAVGPQASADAVTTIAIGSVATADADNAIAIGLNASAGGADAIAIGNTAAASNASGVAIGNGAVAFTNAVAVGDTTTASNNGIALGDNVFVNQSNSIGIGSNVTLSGASEGIAFGIAPAGSISVTHSGAMVFACNTGPSTISSTQQDEILFSAGDDSAFHFFGGRLVCYDAGSVIGGRAKGSVPFNDTRSVDYSVASNTALATVLSETLEATQNYAYKVHLWVTTQGGGARFQLVGPAGSEINMHAIYGTGANSMERAYEVEAVASTSVVLVPNVAANNPIIIEGTIETTGTGGSLQVLFAQETSNANATILRRNSRLAIERI